MAFINNIVGFTRKSAFAKIGKSDTYNMLVEVKDQNEHGFSTVLKPMPGYRKVCDVEGKPNGIYRVSRSIDGKPGVYGVWGQALYLIRDEKAYKIGELAGTGSVTFCETSGYGQNHPHLVVCDGVNLYAVDTTIEVMEQQAYFRKHSPIELPFAYPDSKTSRIVPSWVAYLYGYLVVGSEGTDIFYHSYQYPFESRDEKGNIDYDIFDVHKTDLDKDGRHTGYGYGHWVMSEWQPDNTIVGCSNGSRLFTFGERSFQVFAFQNSVDMPFASPDTASQSIGIKTKSSFATYGGSVFWLGSADMGGNTVFMMDGNANPQRISTDEIEEMISGYNKSLVKCFCMRVNGHPLYVMNFDIDNITLAYDIKEGGWIRLGSLDNKGHEVVYRYRYATVSSDDKLWLQGDGCLVEATTDDWYEHDGTPITRRRVGGIVSSDHKPFKVASVRLLTNNGDYKKYVGKPARVSMRYSRNGTTWYSMAVRSLGRAGQYGYDTTFRNLGRAEHFSVEISSSDNIPFALYGIDIDPIRTGS